MTIARFLRIEQVLELVPVSRTTWWRGVKAKKYPQPVNISNKRRLWRESEIMRFIDNFNRPVESATERKSRRRIISEGIKI